MTNIRVTIYTQDKGRLDLTQRDYMNFNFDNIIYHRTDSPAEIWYRKDGSVECERYYMNGNYHRTDGPAVIWYYQDGSIDLEFYYINNEYYNKEDYYNLINGMKALPKSLRLTHELWWVREL